MSINQKIFIDLVADPRDVLQSLSYHLNHDQYVEHLMHIANAGFEQIMVGSLVNEKLVPAMAGSEIRARKFWQKLNSDKVCRQILLLKPEGHYLEKAKKLIAEGAINSLAYTHSFWAHFLYQNNGIGRKDLDIEKDQETIIERSRERICRFVEIAKETGIRFDIHMSKITHQLANEELLPSLLEKAKREFITVAGIVKGIPGRILVSDTGGEATAQTMAPLMKCISEAIAEEKIDHEVGLHLHTNPRDNEGLVELLIASLTPLQELENNCKVSLDIGFGGIGGCPFDSDSPKANLQLANMLEIYQKLLDRGMDIKPQLDEKLIVKLDKDIQQFIHVQPGEKLSTMFD